MPNSGHRSYPSGADVGQIPDTRHDACDGHLIDGGHMGSVTPTPARRVRRWPDDPAACTALDVYLRNLPEDPNVPLTVEMLLGGGGLDFTDADLSGLDLQGAELSEAILRGVRLVGCDLNGAWMLLADLRDCDLSSADLRNVQARDCNAAGATLRGARLQEADFAGTDFRSADLRDAVAPTRPVLTAGARSAVASGARVIWLGAYGTGPSAAVASALNRLVLKGLGAEVADKIESDAVVTEAGGTVFHARPLSNKPISPNRRTVGLDASPKSIFRIMVSRDTVAAAMLDEAENPWFPGRIAVPLAR